MRPALRFALALLILLPMAGAIFYFAGYQRVHAPILAHAGFGQTPDQCQAAYGPANLVTTNQRLGSPKTRGYIRGGLSVMVGFDEQDHAEQFVISRANLLKKEPLSEPEQQALLAAFGDGSVWTAQPDNGNGPIWQNTEGDSAAYIKDQGWLVLMSKEGMDRKIKALHAH